MTDSSEPVDLTRHDCLRLLDQGMLGRVVFTASAMPAVQPVRYALHGDEVVFPVADDGPLSTATRHAVVGFHVDDVDPVTHVGWSVLGVGRAYALSRTDRRATPAAGPASHMVAVPLQQLTGRRFQLGEVDAGQGSRSSPVRRPVPPPPRPPRTGRPRGRGSRRARHEPPAP